MEKKRTRNDEYYYSLVRRNIKKYRLINNMTQQELADLAEVSREYICDIENESRNKHVTIGVLGRIANALNISIKLLFEKDTPEKEKETQI